MPHSDSSEVQIRRRRRHRRSRRYEREWDSQWTNWSYSTFPGYSFYNRMNGMSCILPGASVLANACNPCAPLNGLQMANYSMLQQLPAVPSNMNSWNSACGWQSFC